MDQQKLEDLFQAKELKLLNAELEKKVQERTKEIENAKSVLEVRVQARTMRPARILVGQRSSVAVLLVRHRL